VIYVQTEFVLTRRLKDNEWIWIFITTNNYNVHGCYVSTICWHYFLLNTVQRRLCSSNASKLADYSACKQMISSHEGVLRIVEPLNFAKISLSSPTLKCSQFVTWRQSFTWMNVVTWSYDLLHLSTVRWHLSDYRQVHFEPGSVRLLSSPSRHYSLI